MLAGWTFTTIATSGPAATNAAGPTFAAPHQLHAVLLTVLPYLDPPSRLALWRTSRPLALLVWDCMPTASLSLDGSGGIWGLKRALGMQGRGDAVPGLLARCSQRISALLPRDHPWQPQQRIQILTLTDVRLTNKAMAALASLPNLKELRLKWSTLELEKSAAQASLVVVRRCRAKRFECLISSDVRLHVLFV